MRARIVTRIGMSPANFNLGRRLATAAILLVAAAQPASATGDIERGAYLARIMDCGGCHTPGALSGRPRDNEALSGAETGFAVPDLGIFFPPNLTPDKETGIGNWSSADIIRAIREGVDPDGRELAPVMAFRNYAVLTDADAADLAAFLKSLPPVSRAVPGPFGPNGQSTAPYFALTMPVAK
jgi:mono/diheme cytochrome c family protein